MSNKKQPAQAQVPDGQADDLEVRIDQVLERQAQLEAELARLLFEWKRRMLECPDA